MTGTQHGRWAEQHQALLLDEVSRLLRGLRHARPDVVAEQLVMLRAGAMPFSAVGHRADVGDAFVRA
jgi:hypothetical protein